MSKALQDIQKREIVETLKIFNPQLIILFGSYVSQNAIGQSDIDIGFFTQKKVDNLQRWEIQERIASRLLVDVDLVDMSSANDVLNFQIVSTGEVLYKKDEMYAESFMDRVYTKYLQLNEDRKEILECY
ncbi:MAG: type VII toxin-antitoxin system MntA family adenylyltransferase antitoxin [Campylobacterales bacterium]